MKKLIVLGSTGSVGVQTLNVARALKEEIEVIGLAAKQNVDLIEQQIREFSPKVVCLYDEAAAKELKRRCPKVKVVTGVEGLCEVATHDEANFAMLAMVGTDGIRPALAAIESGKDIGVVNKELLVAAGHIMMDRARACGVHMLPVDSEHSAIFQCLRGESKESIERLVLTASGGPFLKYTNDELANITADDAANHPNWTMGKKVSIDCSTLMNKGFEVIEARWLFDIPLEKIDVVIHPQSLVHSFVEFIDGSMKAQISLPSMELPIQYAITYPDRRVRKAERLPFEKMGRWEFYPADRLKFRCLDLAYASLEAGGSCPCYMNAANEVLVDRFCEGELSWHGIGEKLETLMMRHQVSAADTVEALLDVELTAQRDAATI